MGGFGRFLFYLGVRSWGARPIKVILTKRLINRFFERYI